MSLTFIKKSWGWEKWGLVLVGVLMLSLGGWVAWRNYHKPKPPVPAQQQAQEAVTTATQAIAVVSENVKKGKALIKKLPGEVKKIEEDAVSASRNADLNQLASRANQRIRNWVTQHSTSNAIQPPNSGAGPVLPGGSSKNQ